jgi:acetyl esterase/lipase
VTEVTAAGLPAYWLSVPGVDPDRVLLFVHGGRFSMGSLRSHGELAVRLGRAAGMRVLFPEYRLAPEHPFPAAVDDVKAVWRWLRNEQDRLRNRLRYAVTRQAERSSWGYSQRCAMRARSGLGLPR